MKKNFIIEVIAKPSVLLGTRVGCPHFSTTCGRAPHALRGFAITLIAFFLLAAPAAITASELKRNHVSLLEGWSFGLGAGALGGGNISAGYRMPYNPDNPNNWMNRFVFRADFNTWAPFGGILENVFENIADDEIDDHRRPDGTIGFTGNITARNAEFNSSVTGRNLGVLVDFHPFTYTRGLKGFRVSGGYYFGSLDIRAAAAVDDLASKIPEYNNYFKWENVNIGGSIYAPMISGLEYGASVGIKHIRAEPKLTLRSTGPYVGIGWDVGLFSNLKMTFDAGVAFTKAHEMSITDNLDELDFTISSSTLTINIDGDPSIPSSVKGLLSDAIQSQLIANNVHDFTVDNNNITVNTAQLIEHNRSAIDSALDNVRADRDKAIIDVNKELKNYAFFPMVKIGFMWRF